MYNIVLEAREQDKWLATILPRVLPGFLLVGCVHIHTLYRSLTFNLNSAANVPTAEAFFC